MRYVILGVLFFALAGCEIEVPEEKSIYAEPSFEEFIELNCEARKLKNERFALAEKLRRDENFVSNPDSLKKALANESRELAEIIRIKLEDLTTEMSLDQKRVFNDSLEARIVHLDCK